jgi:murein DD-endopeptidase MepM/ murein hydrolase activator NlpD
MDLPLPAAVASVPRGPGSAASGAAGTSEAERRSIRDVAQEFESLLLLQMIKQMRQTFLEEPSEEQGFGNETMTETIDVELAKSLARQGGLGLADSIERSLARAVAAPATGPGVVDGSTQSVAVPTRVAPLPPTAAAQAALHAAVPAGQRDAGLSDWGGVAVREPVESGVPDLDLPLSDRVSSAFGWRIDPFHGVKRFHAGIDFAAAYGRPVPVAAPGRVVEAGAQGGYGMTVVVDHGAGVQTRYAHLSNVTVEVGQELARAEVVGRVGQSGRATGPHLHFEVALNGRKVDPALAASRVPGGLKFPGDVVDSSVDGVPVGQPAVE